MKVCVAKAIILLGIASSSYGFLTRSSRIPSTLSPLSQLRPSENPAPSQTGAVWRSKPEANNQEEEGEGDEPIAPLFPPKLDQSPDPIGPLFPTMSRSLDANREAMLKGLQSLKQKPGSTKRAFGRGIIGPGTLLQQYQSGSPEVKAANFSDGQPRDCIGGWQLYDPGDDESNANEFNAMFFRPDGMIFGGPVLSGEQTEWSNPEGLRGISAGWRVENPPGQEASNLIFSFLSPPWKDTQYTFRGKTLRVKEFDPKTQEFEGKLRCSGRVWVRRRSREAAQNAKTYGIQADHPEAGWGKEKPAGGFNMYKVELEGELIQLVRPW
uniref:Plastid lipid-associated protein/fibrillin conserved domain-containing protein n=1 Tax=Fibrocapsa japonica TaxID=94617 RepID=A0A7S2V113_9STRA|mmetsp:Transcript_24039/g.34921  ORF Transcript_24039/g.34921 Transcript_24039/m.34921 type:complete len:324 (+) Transcript_24039:113-1084(+)|eukprot:CAMPEP_0113935310 /NCGR_PEP_ID=MMETSP1339-20121228/2470_1 /TAXON_ID=94617 /ORGANISM="Fibrocapsa japonica" /LENGTH=323 /DNA_ID=CAMNT_0000937405 /DNA_START=112 /DNA_END=1083 /DNA_ORIENTATION=+ /assembly_acc=CAM_ASM_000762